MFKFKKGDEVYVLYNPDEHGRILARYRNHYLFRTRRGFVQHLEEKYLARPDDPRLAKMRELVKAADDAAKAADDYLDAIAPRRRRRYPHG